MLSLGQIDSDCRKIFHAIRNNLSSIHIQRLILFFIAKQMTFLSLFYKKALENHSGLAICILRGEIRAHN
jgi:hypothetical protein